MDTPSKSEAKNEAAPTVEPSKIATVSADELVAPLAETMPEVTNKGPDYSAAEFGSPPRDYGLDSLGRKFDPSVHAINDDGSPKKNARGHYYKAGFGRPKKPTFGEVPTFAGMEGEEPVTGVATPIDKYAGTAESYLQLTYAAATAYFGPDIRPTPEEHEALKSATAAVAKKYKAGELSPEVQLAALSAGVFFSKLQKPSVREKWDALVVKVKSFFVKKKT